MDTRNDRYRADIKQDVQKLSYGSGTHQCVTDPGFVVLRTKLKVAKLQTSSYELLLLTHAALQRLFRKYLQFQELNPQLYWNIRILKHFSKNLTIHKLKYKWKKKRKG
jgi:hypothetical protein